LNVKIKEKRVQNFKVVTYITTTNSGPQKSSQDSRHFCPSLIQ